MLPVINYIKQLVLDNKKKHKIEIKLKIPSFIYLN